MWRTNGRVAAFHYPGAERTAIVWRWGWQLFALYLLALAIRLLYLWQWHDSYLFSVPIGDGRKFVLWAQEIAAGDWLGKESFFHAPLYPYLLGIAFKVFGDSLWVPRLINVAVGAASCVLVAQAGAMFFSRSIGLIAGLGLALYAPAIFLDGLLQKTAVGVFFSCCGVMLWAFYRQAPKLRTAFFIGVVFACASEVHESSLALLAISALWFAVGVGGLTRRFRVASIAALALGTTLVLVPVGLRNQQVGGSFLITTYNFGTNFWYGNNPGADGHHQGFEAGRGDTELESVDTIREAERLAGHPMTPSQASRFWFARALGYITDAPTEWLKLTLRKYLMVWYRFEWHDTDSQYAYEEASPLLRALALPFNFAILVPLAMIGLAATMSRWKELWPLYAAIMGVVASVTFFVVFARYRFPLVPLLMPFAAAGASELWQCLRTRRARGASIWVAAALAVLLVNTNLAGFTLRDSRESEAVNLHGIGLRLSDAGRLPEAESVLAKAMALAPNAAFPVLAMSMIKARQQRFEEQVNYLRHGLRLAPAFRQARRALAVALIELGKQRLKLGDRIGARRSLAEAATSTQFLKHDEYQEVVTLLGRIAAS